MSRFTIEDLFVYCPGTHGLTEEIIYNSQPTSSDDAVPIFSGSADNEVPIGYIKHAALNKMGEPVSYFTGPCVILTKDGSAGLLTYRDSSQGEFALNHHACVLRLKPERKGRVDEQWFALQYRTRLTAYATSKSDNRVFSTEWFDRVRFDVPDWSVQQTQKSKKLAAVSLLSAMDSFLAGARKDFAETYAKTVPFCSAVLGEVLRFRGGNPGLTEEFIYGNRPICESDTQPILSSATQEANQMGQVSRNAMPLGKSLRVFSGPCVLVARNGYAGTMRYIAHGEFTTNDHAYVLTPRKEWENKVNLRWFAHRYQSLFFSLVTSKSDNATFSKDYAKRQKVSFPDPKVQDRIAEKLLALDHAVEAVQGLRDDLHRLIACAVR
jgi:hypothetical protein